MHVSTFVRSVIIALGVAVSSQATAAPKFYIDSELGLALDVKNAGRENGTDIQLWEPNTSSAQQWELIDANGYYFIRSGTGKFLDVRGADSRAGTAVQTWEFVGGANQKWRLVGNDDGSYLIQSALGTYLDVQWSVDDAGTPVWTWTLNGSAAQRWYLSSADPTPSGVGLVVVPLNPETPRSESRPSTQRTVSLQSVGAQCPVGATRGDTEFGGGPMVHSSVKLSVSPDRRSILARATFFATETGGDESTTEGVWSVRVYTIEAGKRIVAINSGDFSEVVYRGGSAGPEFLACNDGAVESHAPGFGPARSFSVIADTGAADISGDVDCRCDTQLREVVLRPISISVSAD